MVAIVAYTIMELINFYLAYRIVLGVRFIKRKILYIVIITVPCITQLLVLNFVDETWVDIIIIVSGCIGAVCLTEKKRMKTFLLYPIAFFIPSLINILGSFVLAFLLGIEQYILVDSTELTVWCEWSAVFVFTLYGYLMKKKRQDAMSMTYGQYLVLLIGVICFFIIITFSQGLLENNLEFIGELKQLTAVACVVMALVFMGLSMWQQFTWKKAYRYQMDNEKYEVFLKGQEEHIRMLIIEDEKRRKLRHDMNAHMLAMETMIKEEEWGALREYLQHMRRGLDEASVNKYTMISAVDAIVDEWYAKAVENNVEWSWEGTLIGIKEINIFEWCTLFSNLLSNAVEAVEKLERDKKIQIRVSNFQEKVVISVRNTCARTQVSDDRLYTTKEDIEFHGLGLKNVEDIVRKHGGCIDYTVKEGWFRVDIVI